ncbi:MAG: HD domain-containing protein [Solirubrobacterales bacterium]|nr:HD domain-containing protein [Solirubrobacterales bacterium]
MVTLTKRYEKAVKFARKAHKKQVRKGTEIPYISHLLGVSSIVLEMEGSEDEAIAALLHDVVEDCGGAPMAERVREEFGADVARIVLANTDTDQKPKPPWRARKQEYLNSLPGKARDELLISLADKLHNARATLLDYRCIGDDIWPRFKEGREGQLWYLNELVRHFTARADDLGPQCVSKLDDFVRTIRELSAEMDRSHR